MNKDLFFKVYKNKAINTVINNQIRRIHKKIYRKRYEKKNWKHLLKSSNTLAQYGYGHLLKLETLDKYELSACARRAAQFGHLDLLKSITAFKKIELSEVFNASLRGGHLHICNFIRSLQGRLRVDSFRYTAYSGNVEICNWFVYHYGNDYGGDDRPLKYCGFDFVSTAAFYGNLDVFKWAIQFFDDIFPMNEELWIDAVTSRNIELLEFMYNHKRLKSLLNPFVCIENGGLGAIVWILSKEEGKSLTISEEILLSLIIGNSIKKIEYYATNFDPSFRNHKNFAEWLFISCQNYGFNAIDYAIENGCFKTMKWIYLNTDFKGTINPLADIENFDSIDLLKWFTENNRPEIIPNDVLETIVFCKDINDSYPKILKYISKNRKEIIPNDD